MKRILLLVLLGLLAFFANCGTIDQNIQARKNLADCKYDLEKIELAKIDFKDVIIPKSVWFDVYLKITNTAQSDVVLDRVEADIFLDEKKLTEIAHKNFVRISPKASAVEKINLEIGFDAIAGAVGKRPQNITIQAKVYVNILIGSFTLKTPFAVTIKKTFPIPYDKIEQEIQKKKSGAVDKVIPNEVKDAGKKIKKLF